MVGFQESLKADQKKNGFFHEPENGISDESTWRHVNGGQRGAQSVGINRNTRGVGTKEGEDHIVLGRGETTQGRAERERVGVMRKRRKDEAGEGEGVSTRGEEKRMSDLGASPNNGAKIVGIADPRGVGPDQVNVGCNTNKGYEHCWCDLWRDVLIEEGFHSAAQAAVII